MTPRGKPPAFDPWTGTLNEAEEARERLRAEGKPGNPVRDWVRAQNILSLRARVEAGEARALFLAVGELLEAGLPDSPSWLGSAFSQGLRKLETAQAKGYEEAFGPYFPKRGDGMGNQAPARRDRFDLAWKVYDAVLDFLRAGGKRGRRWDWDSTQGPVDEAYTKVAEMFGIGRTRAQEYCKAVQEWIAAQDQRSEMLLGKEPRKEQTRKGRRDRKPS